MHQLEIMYIVFTGWNNVFTAPLSDLAKIRG